VRALGIILAGGKNERLGDLTSIRATSAMPIGSCYRAIDFTLSNMRNSGINKVAVITQYNARSLNDHLSSAKWWDFGSKQGGLFVFTPYLSNENSFWFRGTADSMFQNITYLKRSNEPYVIIASGDGVYKFDFNRLIQYHVDKEADVTIMCRRATRENPQDFGVLELGPDGAVIDIEEKPVEPSCDTISMGIYIISRTLLIKLLETANAEGRHDFVKDILIRYRKKLRLFGYRHDDYWATLYNVQAYFDVNMDFLKRDVRVHLLDVEPFIESKPKDEPPAKYNAGADVRDALIGSGGILDGNVSHSVLFRKVTVREHSSVRSSVLMEGCFIGSNCVVEYAILDKEVIVPDGKQVIGAPDDIKIVRKGTLV
jgi:glucose-1-phosphate adenylyltransferase